MTVEATGFKRMTVQGVQLNIDQKARVDIALEAEVPLVQSDTSELGTTKASGFIQLEVELWEAYSQYQDCQQRIFIPFVIHLAVLTKRLWSLFFQNGRQDAREALRQCDASAEKKYSCTLLHATSVASHSPAPDRAVTKPQETAR